MGRGQVRRDRGQKESCQVTLVDLLSALKTICYVVQLYDA